MSEIVEFIRERAAEDRLRQTVSMGWYKALLDILKLHEEWPILIHHAPQPARIENVTDFNEVRMTLIQNIEWGTQKSYVERFGGQAPTTPIVRAYAQIWKDHSAFRPEWA